MKTEFIGKVKDNKVDFYTKNDVKILLNKLEDKEVIVTIEKKTNKRTLRQNNALHLFFQLLANELNNSGLDMRNVLKKDIDISWTLENVKEYLWRPVQVALLKKKSTTKLTTDEIDKVYDMLNRHLGQKFGLPCIPFPSEEDMILNL